VAGAHALALGLYPVTRKFPKEELYGLTSQIRRSSFSIGANLAEGCGRGSDAELARYVQIAMGSASELHYHLILACDLLLLEKTAYQRFEAELISVRKMLTAFQQTLKLARKAAGGI
jgi:four helix bundle protein